MALLCIYACLENQIQTKTWNERGDLFLPLDGLLLLVSNLVYIPLCLILNYLIINICENLIIYSVKSVFSGSGHVPTHFLSEYKAMRYFYTPVSLKTSF